MGVVMRMSEFFLDPPLSEKLFDENDVTFLNATGR